MRHLIPAAIAVAALTLTACGASKPAAPPTTRPPTAAPVAAPIPTPTPTVNPPTRVKFIVTGAGAPSIQYGSDSDSRTSSSGLGALGDGNALPWHTSMPFDPDAQYYSLSAQLEGGGNIECKIVVTGPGDVPLTVSSGHAQGGYSICSAQAAPSNGGLNWQDEG
jgi:hypothetical protein